ncbi:MAG: WG repeat-containing protein [bacterium]
MRIIDLKKIGLYLLFFIIFTEIDIFCRQLYPIAVDDKVGYIDSTGTIIIEPQFETIIQYYEITANGEKLKGVKFPSNAHFSEGYATVRDADYFLFIPLRYHYSLINSDGKLVLFETDYEIGPFKDNFAVVRQPIKHFQYVYDNKFGLINNKVQTIIQPKYKWVGQFNEGLILVLLNDGYGYTDLYDSLVIYPAFQDGTNFSEGLAAVSINDKYGYIDKNGSMIIPEQFVKAWSFVDGLARVYDGNRFFYIDKKGNKLFDNTYTSAANFSEGYAKVFVDGFVGFIDKSGIMAIPAQFNNATDFTNGTAAVEINGKWGFIDKSGMFILQPKYDYANNFEKELSEVWIDKEMWYINKKGEKISKVFWDEKTFLWW